MVDNFVDQKERRPRRTRNKPSMATTSASFRQTDPGYSRLRFQGEYPLDLYAATLSEVGSFTEAKYAPFSFKVERDEKGRAKVTVERMFGCHCHSNIRKKLIQKHGCRTGWEPFGQWSLKKAEEKAKRQTELINAEEGLTSDEGWSSEEEVAKASSICNNGSCAWKSRQKFDDVKKELTGEESNADQIYEFYDSHSRK
ncbi:hypothetical protein MHU86_10456 [Fragilaria crotonensis]|nr:hypothetical protein MHU86_10456 [Fragilaria crotonensis]